MASMITLGIICPKFVYLSSHSSTNMTQPIHNDYERPMVAVARAWGDAKGINFDSVVFLDFDTHSRKLYGTVKYFDSANSHFRHVFFDLKYFENKGWVEESVIDFASLSNFSAPLISPQHITSNIIPELLKDHVTNFMAHSKFHFRRSFGLIPKSGAVEAHDSGRNSTR